MTRADLARAVQSVVGLPRRESALLVDMVFSEIFERLIAREDVKLSSFGTFSVRDKPARLGRDPRTGVGAPISARLVVTFRPSRILRARIGGSVEMDELAADAEEADKD
ncbi:integration host factor subunit alpha [Methylocystis bryophila]|uniref:Integration host factor subunit alpha n=1 Tax=Methylocystis bryophila TaxID=655015 RepID=A0A1W6N1A5_9HYPH|nr:integration host factor subunit alpha [Methylocystis bryophila]